MMKNELNIQKANAGRRAARGFTLIEILVVISVIVILVATVLAIGTNVRANAQIRQTKVTLTALQAALNKYAEDGNKLPLESTLAEQESDYVTKFRSVPEIWKMLDKLPTQGTGTSTKINDGFGVPIRYYSGGSGSPGIIKNQGDKNGYFVSGGPDGTISTSGTSVDDIYSFDPS